MSQKRDTLNVTNSLSVSGVLNISQGYQYMDNTYNTNTGLPANVKLGTSESQGNRTRNMFNLNNNGPIQFGNTQDDKKQILTKFPTILGDNPLVGKFPWMYSGYESWSQNTQSILDSSTTEIPICKCLGKGLGNIEIYKVGQAIKGQPDMAGVFQSREQSDFIKEPIYPFDGKIYSGTLVELLVQGDEIVAIPYQTGRGILYDPKWYSPEEDIKPWGSQVWPDTQNVIPPYLAPGAEPQNQSSLYGVVLDSYSSQNYTERVFKSKQPIGQIDDREPWYNHPAPQTIPATSYKGIIDGDKYPTQGFMSPGPNSSGTFWSPWPEYYAYKSGDPIPILTQGVTTVRIGAAYNIATSTYGVSTQVSATKKEWLPLSIIPLFQGERIEAGSLVYACVKGQIQTEGAYAAGFGNPLGQTLWDVNVDTTWGNIGWCGTPGLSFSCIPDNGVSQIETRSSGVNINFLNQSSQGSVIVQAVTSVSPYPGLGNPFNPRAFESLPEFTATEIYNLKKERFALPGVSGRGCLSQMVPEKAQPIGVVMETIEGTGKWPYTGIPLDPPLDETIVFLFGGSNYGISVPSEVGTRNGNPGVQSGMTVTWSMVTSSFPRLGTINQNPDIVTPGTGYADGDLIIVNLPTEVSGTGLYQPLKYKCNNATYVLENGSLFAQLGGSRYLDSTKWATFNLTRNSVYLGFDDNSGTLLYDNFIKYQLPQSDFPQYFDNYVPEETVIRVVTQGLYQDSAVFRVLTMGDNNCTLERLFEGANYPPGGTILVYETEIINWTQRAPYVEVQNQGGKITDCTILDYGVGVQKDDVLLVVNDTLYTTTLSDNNAIFQFPGKPGGNMEIIGTCPWYEDGTYTCVAINTSAPDVESIVITDPQRPNESIPVFVRPDVGETLTEGAIYHMQSSKEIYSPSYRRYSSYVYNGNYIPLVGGSSYANDVGVRTYNMTANSLVISMEISNNLIIGTTSAFTTVDDGITSRYEVGMQLRIMKSDVEIQAIVELTDVIGGNLFYFDLVSSGGNYNLPDGNYNFHTQRLDQVNPTVSLVCELYGQSNDSYVGQVRKVLLDTVGTNNELNDILVITQDGSDNNAYFLYNSEGIGYVDLPPFATLNGYIVDTSQAAWDKYNEAMQTATNLMDKHILVEIRNNQGQYMENILPNAQQHDIRMPGNENPFRSFYK